MIRNLKQAKRNEIKDLEEQKKEISENSKKLIELSGKTLIFLGFTAGPSSGSIDAIIIPRQD